MAVRWIGRTVARKATPRVLNSCTMVYESFFNLAVPLIGSSCVRRTSQVLKSSHGAAPTRARGSEPPQLTRPRT